MPLEAHCKLVGALAAFFRAADAAKESHCTVDSQFKAPSVSLPSLHLLANAADSLPSAGHRLLRSVRDRVRLPAHLLACRTAWR